MPAQNRPIPIARIPKREPGIRRLLDHLSVLYLDAGIVTPTVIPKLPNPAARPMAYLRQGGDEYGNR